MASSADSHAAVLGAGTLPSDSRGAVPVKKAGGAAPWKLPASAAEPEAVTVFSPIIDADSWPALPGLASPPAAAAAATAKSSPKAAPPPPTEVVVSPVSLGNPSTLDTNPDEASVRNPAAQRALMMPTGDALEKSTPSPELCPVHVPNTRSNGGDHHQNGRFGSHPHGRGGSYGGGNKRGNGGDGGRRGHEHHGSINGQRRGGGRRDGHGPAHQQRPTHIRPPTIAVVAGGPPPPPPFATPANPQTPPYGAPMGFPDMTHVYYFAPSEGIQGLSFMPHPASPQAILIDPLQIQKELVKQIDYYFCDANLCKDIFLRQHMDDQGWVTLSLIANFRKVQKLTNNIQFILESVRLSTVVEVQGDNIRRKGTWENWLLPKPRYSTGTSSGSMPPVTSNIDPLASRFQSIGLEGADYYTNMQTMPGEALLTRSATATSFGYNAPTFFGPNSAKNLLRSGTF